VTAPVRLALTQGDPAGVGPEILLRLAGRWVDSGDPRWRPLLVAERAALDALRDVLPDAPWDRLHDVSGSDGLGAVPDDAVPVLDPVGPTGSPRPVTFGVSGPADAGGALAALDAGVALVTGGHAAALVTAPLAKDSIARHVLPGFVGHTDYLAQGAGLERYGRDYLMAFLAPRLRVALLSTHLPLADALERVTGDNLLAALRCMNRHLSRVSPEGAEGPRIAVAAVDPHAGEGGLLGTVDDETVRPAVAAARQEGIDAHGPESADSLFARALQGEFDWVLSLYHDQGLIAVKTAAFGRATNWTLGLPYLRTSVDHGTAFGIAGRGVADAGPLGAVVETTLELLRADPGPSGPGPGPPATASG
jgi:4-hydroxythreonine-4-phosphate dehydrogenase